MNPIPSAEIWCFVMNFKSDRKIRRARLRQDDTQVADLFPHTLQRRWLEFKSDAFGNLAYERGFHARSNEAVIQNSYGEIGG